jgi:hypothetical protein
MVVTPNDGTSWQGDIVPMTLRTNPSRRWFAVLCLTVSWALANWGSLALQPLLGGWIFSAWWLVCGILACVAVILASIDLVSAWRGFQAARRRGLAGPREEIEKAASRAGEAGNLESSPPPER